MKVIIISIVVLGVLGCTPQRRVDIPLDGKYANRCCTSIEISQNSILQSSGENVSFEIIKDKIGYAIEPRSRTFVSLNDRRVMTNTKRARYIRIGRDFDKLEIQDETGKYLFIFTKVS